jgi:DNA modification methylase
MTLHLRPIPQSAEYRQFLEAKIKLAEPMGFDVPLADIAPGLKPFNRDIVRWALLGGQRAIFAAFGLHKTAMGLELMRQVGLRTRGPTLITLPLDVRHEFFAEHIERGFDALGQKLKFIQSDRQMDGDDVTYLTNYEPVRDGKFDLKLFAGAHLDEAAVLRGFGGSKTFREFMRLFESVRYRFVATATPSPNEYIELLAYAAFLGIMDVGQAKTRFFKRDSENADQLTIHPHKTEEFWRWVSSWAIFVQKPSDLGYSDEGYELPELDVHWHEIASEFEPNSFGNDGQGKLLADDAIGVVDASREKRRSLDARIAKMLALREIEPAAHRILWHDLEAERAAIERAVPGVGTVYGSQDPEERSDVIHAFREGRLAELGAKPVMLGSGGNLQKHCHWHVFLGIGFKFKDFIQAIYRLQRFGQTHRVRADLIYTDKERPVRQSLETKWRQDSEMRVRMSALIREYGLANASIDDLLGRSIGLKRQEIAGDGYTLVNNDCVEECARMAADSVDLIVTSIPFSTQYEYTPSYNDFGHTDDDAHFWAQMDYLIPNLLRVLRPGRVAAIHVKDRIVPGGLSGLGFQTVSPFSDDCIARFRKHGFAFLARKTIVTDVVRENNQTYRLGWTEQCKDGTRMGAGLPEYLLVFRKPPSDLSNGYADVPVTKEKPWCDDHGEARQFDTETNWKQPVMGTGYSRARWQFDAHGMARSSGDRLVSSAELRALPHDQIYKLWRARSRDEVYDFDAHVAVAEDMDRAGRLPSTFMLLPPHSWHPDVWTDVTRMRTLNGAQHSKGKEMHLCPLQFDIVDRAIVQYTMPGETVFDPFGGLMTVPYCAILLKRRGVGVELSPGYFRDGAAYCEAASAKMAVPSLFDFLNSEFPKPAEMAAASDGLEQCAAQSDTAQSNYPTVAIEAGQKRGPAEDPPVVSDGAK